MSNVLYIYKIERISECDYDEYSDAVVIALSEDDAKTIHPNININKPFNLADHYHTRTWVESLDDIIVTLIGVAAVGIKRGVISSSFNAG